MYALQTYVFPSPLSSQLQVDGKNVPTAVKALSKHRVLDVSLGPTHGAALVEPGLVYIFGDNHVGQLACGNCKPRDVPALVKALEDKTTTVSLKTRFKAQQVRTQTKETTDTVRNKALYCASSSTTNQKKDVNIRSVGDPSS